MDVFFSSWRSSVTMSEEACIDKLSREIKHPEVKQLLSSLGYFIPSEQRTKRRETEKQLAEIGYVSDPFDYENALQDYQKKIQYTKPCTVP